MKFKFFNFSFFILMISNMLIFFSNSWFFMWMIMEINLISFIKILTSNKKFNPELFMNYFLIQSMNSYLFIMSFMLMNMNFLNEKFNLLIIISMMCKMGTPPFMSWYIKMMNFLKCWIMFFINSCLQKLIPLMIINNIINNKILNLNFLIIMILFSSSFISIMGLNSLNLWIIMSISSIIQTLWMMMMIFINEMWISYFFVYSTISMSTMLMFKIFNMNFISDMYFIKFNNKMNLYMLCLNLFSLGGIPPFLGFMNKFLFMWNFSKMNMITSIIMIINSMINLYFYLNIILSNMMFNFNFKNMTFKFINFNYSSLNNTLLMMWLISILGFMFIEMI